MELQGYSGCNLKIIENYDYKVVKKSSPRKSYNSRLVEQKNKQKNCNLGQLRNCTVYDDGFDDGLYYFNMEYINGKTFAEWIEQVELISIKNVVEKLTDYYKESYEKNCEADIIFKNKICSLKNTLCGNSKTRENITIDKAFFELDSYSWLDVVSTPCHGDMTLENILVKENEYYLIDLLDSFYDTWMIDAAKLLQDAECYWSYRRCKMSENLKVRLLIFKDILIDKVKTMSNGSTLLDTIYHILLLNLLRILPYTEDDFDYVFLLEKIELVTRKLRGGKLEYINNTMCREVI